MVKKKIKKEYSQPQKFLWEKLLGPPISPTRKSTKNFLGWRYSKLLLLVIFLLVIIGLYLSIISKVNDNSTSSLPSKYNKTRTCDEITKHISDLIHKANYCDKDLDCIVSNEVINPLGDCRNLINKNEDMTEIKSQIDTYTKNCPKVLRDCPPQPFQNEISCQNNVCATKNIFTEPKVYVLTHKKQYQKWETVHVIIYNNLGTPIWIPKSCGAPLKLLKYEPKGWIEHHPYPLRDCEFQPLKIEKGARREFINLEQVYGYSSFVIKPGAYKFKLLYSMVEPSVVSDMVYNNAFSDEFTIIESEQTTNIDLPIHFKPYPKIDLQKVEDFKDKVIYEVEGDYTEFAVNDIDRKANIKRARDVSSGGIYSWIKNINNADYISDDIYIDLPDNSANKESNITSASKDRIIGISDISINPNSIVTAKVKKKYGYANEFELEAVERLYDVEDVKESLKPVSEILPQIDNFVREQFKDYIGVNPTTTYGQHIKSNTCNTDRICVDGIMLGYDTFWDSNRDKLLIRYAWGEDRTGKRCDDNFKIVVVVIQIDVAKQKIEGIYLHKSKDKFGCPVS